MNLTPAGENDAQRGRFEINEDIDFQRRVWRFERVGWALMGLIGLASLLGLLGPGLLSSAESGDDRLRIEYQRFHRHLSPAELTVHIGKAAVRDGAATLVLNPAFTDKFQIEGIVPQPAQWQLAGDGMHVRFLAADLGSPATVRCYLKPQGYGPAAVEIGLGGAAPMSLRQFIYP
jgi:hypothetical protein